VALSAASDALDLLAGLADQFEAVVALEALESGVHIAQVAVLDGGAVVEHAGLSDQGVAQVAGDAVLLSAHLAVGHRQRLAVLSNNVQLGAADGDKQAQQ
jgi:hypothetical protein